MEPTVDATAPGRRIPQPFVPPQRPLFGRDRLGGRRPIAVVAAAVLFGVSGGPSAHAQWFPRTVVGLPDGAGAALVAVGDVDGDGVDDLAYGASQLGREATAQAHGGEVLPYLLLGHSEPTGDDGRGFVVIASGASGQTLRVLAAPQGALGFGAALALVDDRNGDGLRDLAIGAPGIAHAGEDHRIGGVAGRVFVVSPSTGETLFEYRLEEPRRGFGARLASSPTAPGRLVVAIPDEWVREGAGSSAVYVFQGPSQLPALSIERPKLPENDGRGGFARDVALLSDVNGDGNSDVLVLRAATAVVPGALLLYCGSTGALLREHTSTAPDGKHVAGFLAIASDAGSSTYAGYERDPVNGVHRVRVFAGDGTESAGPSAPAGPELWHSAALAPVGDLNGDGQLDFVLGPALSGAAILLRSGPDAPVELPSPTGHHTDFGISFAALERVGSTPILAVGAIGGRFVHETGEIAGATPFFLFDPASGELLAAAQPAEPPL